MVKISLLIKFCQIHVPLPPPQKKNCLKDDNHLQQYSLLIRNIISICVVYICSTCLFGCLVPIKKSLTLNTLGYAVSPLKEFHSFLIQQYQLIPTEYVPSLVLIDIHSQVFMPHGYTDDISHSYRKSFSLMSKVKSCLLKLLA